MLKKLLVWHCQPGGSQGGSVDRIFFFFTEKKLEVSASNPFEMQAKLYAELTDDIFRYYSVPKNSLLKHKNSLSEPLQCSRKLPTLYRTFGQTEYESLSDRQNFCLTEKQSARFGKIIKGGGWGGGGEVFFIINFL